MNLAVRELARRGLDADGTWGFWCECGCMAVVHMTPAEFDRADGVYVDGHRVTERARTRSRRAS